MRVDISAEFFGFNGPAGFWPEKAFCGGGGLSDYCTQTSGGRESVNFVAGGTPWSSTFFFDTSLANLVTTPDHQGFSWDSSMGPSPLLSGFFLWPDVGLVRDLPGATSFSIDLSAQGLVFDIVGADFRFRSLGNSLFSGVVGFSSVGPFSLSQPWVVPFNCHCQAGLLYTDANFNHGGNLTELFAMSLSPVPEPATWAMLILGFGGIGAVMRRRRVQPDLEVA